MTTTQAKRASLILQHPLYLIEKHLSGARFDLSVFVRGLQIANQTPNLALFEFQAVVTSASGEQTAVLGLETLDPGRAQRALNHSKGFRNVMLSTPGKWHTGGPIAVRPQELTTLHLGYAMEATWELRKSSKSRSSTMLRVRPYNTDDKWLEFGDARCSLNLAV